MFFLTCQNIFVKTKDQLFCRKYAGMMNVEVSEKTRRVVFGVCQ